MGQKNVLNEYEQLRIQRMQENSRKLQELGLENASDTFKVTKAATKPKTVRQKEDPAERRRSTRVAALPACNYEDKDTLNLRGPRRCRPGRARSNLAASSAAMRRAAEAAEEFECKFPSIVKQMMPSHVAGGFWMGLPRGFCAQHMPRQDADMILLDEEGGQWESRYLAHKNGLSGGWRGFALDHNLEFGDVAIFELVKQTTIQMHIIRVADHETGGGPVAGEKLKSKQAKRKTGSRYANVPVQGRTKKSKANESDSEDEDAEDDEEEEDVDEDEDEIENQNEEDICDDSSSSESSSESESDSEEDEESDLKEEAPVSLHGKLQIDSDSDSGSGFGKLCKQERPILLQDDEESHILKRASVTQQGKCLVKTGNRRVKKPQAVRAFDKIKKVPRIPREETLSSEEKESFAPLLGGRPPKPQAVRRLTNVMKSRKIHLGEGKAASKQRA